MRLPETDNPHQQTAFRRGYRLASEGKPITQMPMTFRYDAKLRHYFELGWQQANDERAEALKAQGKTDWKKRGIWLGFAVLSGLLTAKLMIDNIEAEKAEQMARLHPEQITNHAHLRPLENLSETAKNPEMLDHEIDSELALRLLSPQAHQDLKLTQKLYQQTPKQPLLPIQPSTTIFEQAQLLSEVSGTSYEWQTVVPKFERRLKAIFQIQAPDEIKLTIRWRYQDISINDQSVLLEKGLNTLQTTQAMTSARQGRWYIEIWHQNQVIYRQEFDYVQKTEPAS